MQRVMIPRTYLRTLFVAAALTIVPGFAHGQSAPSPTPNPAPPSGQSADPRTDQQSRKNATEAGPGTAQANDQHFIKEAADGGMAEDFLHIAGLIEVLVGDASMRPFILVGIENTERRRDIQEAFAIQGHAIRLGGR